MRWLLLFFVMFIMVSCITDTKDTLPTPRFEVIKTERDCHYLATFLDLKNDSDCYDVKIEVQNIAGSEWYEKINTDREIVTCPIEYSETFNFRVRYEMGELKSEWRYWR
jgi:hypothetical protein